MDSSPRYATSTDKDIADMQNDLKELKQEIHDEAAPIISKTNTPATSTSLSIATLDAVPQRTMTGSSRQIKADQNMPEFQDEVQTQDTMQEATEDSASLSETGSDVSDISGVTLPIPVDDQDSVVEDPSKPSTAGCPMHALIMRDGEPVTAGMARMRKMWEALEEELNEHGFSPDMPTDNGSVLTHHMQIKRRLASIYDKFKGVALLCVSSQADVSYQILENLDFELKGKPVEVATDDSKSGSFPGSNISSQTAPESDHYTKQTTMPHSIDKLIETVLKKLKNIQHAGLTANHHSSDEKIADIEADLHSIKLQKGAIDLELEKKDLKIRALEMNRIVCEGKRVDAKKKLCESVREQQILQMEKLTLETRLKIERLPWWMRLLGVPKVETEEVVRDGRVVVRASSSRSEPRIDWDSIERAASAPLLPRFNYMVTGISIVITLLVPVLLAVMVMQFHEWLSKMGGVEFVR